jgi:microsomal dipeptidase-like Zn-dependent dipeptidase
MFLLLSLLACQDEEKPTSTITWETGAPAPDAAGGDTEPPETGLDDTGREDTAPPLDTDYPRLDTYGVALGCYAVRGDAGWLAQDGAEAYAFVESEEVAARFYLKPADLGTYLLYDQDGGYLVAEDGPLLRQTSLLSDVLLIDDSYISGAEWIFDTSPIDPSRYRLESRRTGQWLGVGGLVAEADAAPLSLEVAEGCLEHPELGVYAEGTPTVTTFEDGDLYGFVDTHSHIMANWGFGGGGIFHGAPFHRLGVQHALADCSVSHGELGRRDIFGYVYDNGASNIDLEGFFNVLLAGELDVDNHATDGYPTFSDWPDAPHRGTHQVQYYRWLERAWLSGMRLVVQHAVSNSAVCDATIGLGIQQSRYSCEDMAGVDRSIDEVYAMERYIDAHHGGPGEGWFRVVTSPAEAREVIAAGKLAVVLGIETSDLFDCRITPRDGSPVCDEAYVDEQLDLYYERGIRVMFPVHKFDNAFSAGDGHDSVVELGNFVNSGHWLNFVEDCPEDVPAIFDGGSVTFGGLNQPREEYLSEPPNDLSGFPTNPAKALLPYIDEISGGSLSGDYCQNAGLTDLGEHLILGMMARGMVLEVDHFPKRSYQRAYELLEEYDYPAAGTHGGNWYGRLYELGGVSKTSFGRCRDANNPGSTLSGFLSRIDLIEASGGYPAEGFGFDLNGFAGARGPRFGDEGCGEDQEDPVEYPFTSYAGDVTFTEPAVGERALDFNTEGFVHIGLVAEIIEDARGDAVSESDLEPLFRSAEGYIRMWEKAETRGAELGKE